MDYLLLTTSILCLLAGFVGSVVPAIPGPPLSWLGLLLLKLSRFGADITCTWLAIFAAIVILATVLDLFVPSWFAKKFGGTKAHAWGAAIGLLAGFFFLPWGMILGPFLGAFAAGIIAGNSGKRSLTASFGAFLGFLFGVGIKLASCGWMACFAVKNFNP